MATGYRRRILIEPHPAEQRVTAELEDDYHRMVVTLTHEDGVITEVESEMKRSPWTLCPGAMAALRETFVGAALAEVPRHGDKTRNCTHLYDLATFAAAHADGTAPLAYEILATDPIDGVRHATLWRDGTRLFQWMLEGDRFLDPYELEGQRLSKIGGWIAQLDRPTAEAARILRWASIVGFGRTMDIPAGIPATSFPLGACYNFQPGRADASFRRPGADRDFSAPNQPPMADRDAAFPATHEPDVRTRGTLP